VIPGGLGHPRVLRGNTAMMRHARPPLGTYFLNDETESIHQWNGVEWEGVGASGSPEKTALLMLFQKQAAARQTAAVARGAGSGSTPGIRVIGTDPSVNDPALFTAPPAPLESIAGGMDVPTLLGGGGDSASQSNMANPATSGFACSIFDDFNRIVVGGWGTSSPSALVWGVSDSGGRPFTPSVNGSAGLINVPSNWPGVAAQPRAKLGAGASGTVPQVNGTFEALIKMRFTSAAPTTNDKPFIQYRFGNATVTTQYGSAALSNQTISLSMLGVAGATTVVVTFPTGFFWLRWVRNWKGTHYLRMWADGAPEPFAWMITRVSTAAETRSTNFFIDFVNATANLPNWVTAVDQITICT
jgi:hypothetical protein